MFQFCSNSELGKTGFHSHWTHLNKNLILRKRQVNTKFIAQPISVVPAAFWFVVLLTTVHLLAPWEMTEMSPIAILLGTST